MALQIADMYDRKLTADHTIVADISFSQSDGGMGTEYGSIRVTFHVDRPENDTTYFNSSDSPLDSLQITAQIDNHEPVAGDEKHSYGWSLHYHSPYTVGLEKAEMMVKFLRRVESAYKKTIQDDGYPITFGQCVLRYLKILGVSQVRLFPTNSRNNNWTSEFMFYNKVRLAEATASMDYHIITKMKNWRESRWNSERY